MKPETTMLNGVFQIGLAPMTRLNRFQHIRIEIFVPVAAIPLAPVQGEVRILETLLGGTTVAHRDPDTQTEIYQLAVDHPWFPDDLQDMPGHRRGTMGRLEIVQGDCEFIPPEAGGEV